MNKIHYEVTEFNKRRLSRGEQSCFRADILVNNKIIDWCWLSMKDIIEILKSDTETISGHEKFPDAVDNNKILWC